LNSTERGQPCPRDVPLGCVGSCRLVSDNAAWSADSLPLAIFYPPSSRSADAQQRVPTGCFSSFHLVSPGFSYQEKNRSGEAENWGFRS